jgi:hypothetical protein
VKLFKSILFFTPALVLLATCGPKVVATSVFQANNPYAPQVGDNVMRRNDITVDSAALSLAKSQPPQVMLNFAYFQPTPCNQLRVEIAQPDSKNRIDITAYAVAEKDKPCALMALATPLQASLNLGSFPSGHYSLWLNGVKVDEFDS